MTGRRTYAVVLSAAAKRAIERDLPTPVAVTVVGFLYGPLSTDPCRAGKPLRFELQGYRSARRGRYRVIYSSTTTRSSSGSSASPTGPTSPGRVSSMHVAQSPSRADAGAAQRLLASYPRSVVTDAHRPVRASSRSLTPAL